MPQEFHDLARRTFLKGVAAGVVGAGLGGVLPRVARAEEEAATTGLAMRTFGRTKRKVTVVGFGGGGLKADNARLLSAAVERGVNFIDTSWGYMGGQSEVEIGKFLATHGDREKLFVNSKASGFRPPSGGAKQVYDAFKAQVVESLQRLQTDYVDGLMWPHGAQSPEQIRNPAMQEALLRLREEGLVRFFGMSSHSNYRATCLAAIEDGFYDHLLTVINVCTQNPEPPEAAESAPETPEASEEEAKEPRAPSGGYAGRRGRSGRAIEDTRDLLAAAREKNVGIMAMKVAKSGFLRPDADALLDGAFEGAGDLTRHQRLYTYGIRQEGVHTVVIGMQAVSHVREALAIAG